MQVPKLRQPSLRSRIMLMVVATVAVPVAVSWLGYFALTATSAVAMLYVAWRLLERTVSLPLLAMIGVARRAEAGEDASFALARSDEIGQLGGALETMRARMNADRQQATSDARTVLTMNRFTDAAPFAEDEAMLARAALEALAEFTGFADAVVHVVTVGHDRAELVAESGCENAEDISIGRFDYCPGVRRGNLYTMPDLERDLGLRCPVHPVGSGTLGCLPLMAGGEAIGAVHLHWREPRTLPLQLRAAMARVSEHTAMTIANRRLIAQLRSRSPLDPHTGLLGTRAFDEALDKATIGRRHGHELAVLLIDLDRFSAFNDRNGTPAGDDALRFFARLLNGCLREGDVASRYGPEEFAVLLPEFSGPQAIDVAERIRQKTETTSLPFGRDDDERLTVSIGVAVAPQDAERRVGVLRAADQALHEAKLLGRNRVVSAGDLDVEDEPETEQPFVPAHMVSIVRDIVPAALDLNAV